MQLFKSEMIFLHPPQWPSAYRACESRRRYGYRRIRREHDASVQAQTRVAKTPVGQIAIDVEALNETAPIFGTVFAEDSITVLRRMRTALYAA